VSIRGLLARDRVHAAGRGGPVVRHSDARALLHAGRRRTRGSDCRADWPISPRPALGYSGTLLTTLGIGLTQTNWFSLIAIVDCTLIGHLCRVRVEEAALRKTLGQPYADYMRRTKRFIPFEF
jgi:hypothetical protein